MFQVTLRAARISCGYSVDEVAKHCGISSQQLSEFEEDCKEMPIGLAKIISKLYQIPLYNIFIGTEQERAEHNCST